MSGYQEFIASKVPRVLDAGFEISDGDINEMLFSFQRALVKWALRRGRAAIFADTGLGKTPMQLEWARHVAMRSGGRVLVLAPLCVSQQTVGEAAKFGISAAYCRKQDDITTDIVVTNYEMLDSFDADSFAGIVLDESSIIKHTDGKTRKKITEAFADTQYRLSCTATPAPNDYMELGNQAEFLGVMSGVEMLAMYFIHDGGDTSKWRLKGHGEGRFWEWLSTWAMVVKRPSDIGFSDEGYDLPPLLFHEHVVESPTPDGMLFPDVASRLLDRNRARKESVDSRVAKCAEIVNGHDRQSIVWCHLNDESAKLTAAIDGAVEVKGADSIDEKESRISAFINGDVRVLISKPKIAGFGLNLQHVHDMAFVGLSDSWEQFYQAVRRCWRFGQTNEVDVHIISAQSEGAVVSNIKRKEAAAQAMSQSMVQHMEKSMKSEIGTLTEQTRSEYRRDVATGNDWTLHLGDCVEVVGEMDSESIDYTIFSPPFASLYTYSDSDRDMGNTKGHDDFMGHFRYLVHELIRVTKPGRLVSFHCFNIPTMKAREGTIGLHDFRGDLIRVFQAFGWIYHSEVCIWKDPVTAMQRTKALGLLHKTIRKDSSMSRMGLPDYVVTMRKPGVNPEPIAHEREDYPVSKWQRVASPIWTDIRQNNTLNKAPARCDDDEKHICPLQLDVIERCLELWSNPRDLVLSPFAGIGSEGYRALEMDRRFVGAELKESYWNVAKGNLDSVRRAQIGLFDG
jgi:DNA modification methylase/superfamily II DNA or RNA helicase